MQAARQAAIYKYFHKQLVLIYYPVVSTMGLFLCVIFPLKQRLIISCQYFAVSYQQITGTCLAGSQFN